MNPYFPNQLTAQSTKNLGAFVSSEGVKYTTWAPERKKVVVEIVGTELSPSRIVELEKTSDGYFIGVDFEGRAGDLYTLNVDGRGNLPDLASRYQSKGLNGPSMVVDPTCYRWQAAAWTRPEWKGQVLYEIHIGTFTKEGTFRAAVARLNHLVELGVTAVEIMPVAECTGGRNWGYDGVLLFAPYHAYGNPDDMRAFVDACHGHGLAVMLDVVYNHIGAVGDPTDAYSRFLTHAENTGPWGKTFNLDGEKSAPVRHLLLQNVAYWLEEFRIDGFRFDATQAIHDKSTPHWVAQAAMLIHSHGGFITAEDDRNSADLLRTADKGGWQLDGLWADDFHHTMRVSQTKESHSYLGRYTGSLEEMSDTLRHGWYFRGQKDNAGESRGTATTHVEPRHFIQCISNHDQVGNRPFGERLHQTIEPDAYRALSLFFCLIPYTPLLFMGQEWAASSPFLFFTDHPEDFGHLVSEGRKREFKFDAQSHGRPLPDCQAEATFLDSKLKWDEQILPVHAGMLALYREALQLRRGIFGKDNPDRSLWKVEAGAHQLALIYTWPEIVLEVKFWMTGSSKEKALPPGKLLLRSNDPRFGGTSDGEIETFVVQR